MLIFDFPIFASRIKNGHGFLTFPGDFLNVVFLKKKIIRIYNINNTRPYIVTK